MGVKAFFQDKVIWPIVKSVIMKKLKGTAMVEWLKGKKAYLLGAAAIIGAVAGFADGKLTLEQAIQAIWGGLTAIALRAGISKVSK